MDDIDKWLRPVPGLRGFPTAEYRALAASVRHLRNVHDTRVFGRALSSFTEAIDVAGRTPPDHDRVRGCLERVNDDLAELLVEREMTALRKTLDATFALIDGGRLGERAAKSLAERSGCEVATFEAAVEVAVSLCIDEALALNAGEWSVRKIERKVAG